MSLYKLRVATAPGFAQSRQLGGILRLFLGATLAWALMMVVAATAYAATVEMIVHSEPSDTNQFPVFVFVDTQDEATIGTDLLVSYDPQELLFVSAEAGSVYPQHHEAVNQPTQGQVRYSATVSGQGESVTAAGHLVTLFFRKQTLDTVVLGADGGAALRLEWVADATNDTNVVSTDGIELLVAPPPPLTPDPDVQSRLGEVVAGVLDDQAWQRLAEKGTLPEGLLADVASAIGFTITNTPVALLGVLLIIISAAVALILIRKNTTSQRAAAVQKSN